MSSASLGPAPRSALPAALVAASLALLAVGVVSGASLRMTAGLVVLVTLAALVRSTYIAWPQLLAALILIILFIPIRRYSLPASLPFQLEPYRVYVALIIACWSTSLLVDRRTRIRRTGLEGPLLLIVGSAIGSLVVNPGRVELFSTDVTKKLMFFLSFVLVLYFAASVVRRVESIEYLTKTLVGGGAIVAAFALVEARTGFNIFNHLSRAIPFLHGGEIPGVEFTRFRTAKLRVFASAEHPIALSAALVMLIPLAFYLARRYRQRRWMLCGLLLVAATAGAVSRTGILMLGVVVLVFLWLRPQETRRLWPALALALVAVHFVLPGTIGAIKASFFPPGGLVAEQRSEAGQSGSGRLADLGPGLREWKQQPLFGEGFGTRVVDGSGPGPRANVLDDQWLGTLLETGAVGFFGWIWLFVRVVRRFGMEARRDRSERGWLLASLAAGIAAYAVGMFTYDAFSFVQVTFLLFILVGLGSALMAEPAERLTRHRERAARGTRPATSGQWT